MAEDEPELPRNDTGGGDEPDGECSFDADDMAILGGTAGVASLILSLFSWSPWPHLLTVPLGVFAIVACWQAQKRHTTHKDEAQSGLYCGVIGLCLWLGLSAVHSLARLFGG